MTAFPARLSSPADVARVCESAGLTRSPAGDEWRDARVTVCVQVFSWGQTKRVVVYKAAIPMERAGATVAELHPLTSSSTLLAAIADARGETEPLHEVSCPQCRATIRARMADRDAPGAARERELRALVETWPTASTVLDRDRKIRKQCADDLAAVLDAHSTGHTTTDTEETT